MTGEALIFSPNLFLRCIPHTRAVVGSILSTGGKLAPFPTINLLLAELGFDDQAQSPPGSRHGRDRQPRAAMIQVRPKGCMQRSRSVLLQRVASSPCPESLARTIATMPVLTGSGSSSHRSTTARNSGEFSMLIRQWVRQWDSGESVTACGSSCLSFWCGGLENR